MLLTRQFCTKIRLWRFDLQNLLEERTMYTKKKTGLVQIKGLVEIKFLHKYKRVKYF